MAERKKMHNKISLQIQSRRMASPEIIRYLKRQWNKTERGKSVTWFNTSGWDNDKIETSGLNISKVSRRDIWCQARLASVHEI